MSITKIYKKSISNVLFVCTILSYANYSLADSINTNQFNAQKTEYKSDGKLSNEEWLKLINYAHEFIANNKDSIVPEKNESGFYRINLKAPAFIPKSLGIEKLRLHYWPIDDSNPIEAESIHDHPKYFESLIINGGYKHSIYTMHNKANIATAEKFNLFRINKESEKAKNFNSLGSIFLNKNKDELVKEGQIVVMPTDVIHRVLFSVPGTLSMNVVYKNKHNKGYYNVMLTENGSEKDIKTSRTKITGMPRKQLINEVEKRLFNGIFQRD